MQHYEKRDFPANATVQAEPVLFANDSDSRPAHSDGAAVEPETLEGDADDTSSASSFKVFDRRFWADDNTENDSDANKPEYPSYVQDLKDQLEAKDKQLREYIAAYKTEVVEGLEETKKRLERDAENQTKALRGELAQPMFEVFEALERSILAATQNTDVEALIDGVKLVHKLLEQKLETFGVKRIETVGIEFDPHQHEAVAVRPADTAEQHNTVIAEFSPGFTLDGTVIRAAKVQVAKFDPASSDAS